MQHIADTITKKTTATDLKDLKTTAVVPEERKLSPFQVTDTLNQISDLTNMPAFKAWYCKAIYKIGPSNILKIADIARTGTLPRLLFSKLLKDALG